MLKEELFKKTIAELTDEFNLSKTRSKEMVLIANGWIYLRTKDQAELDNLKAKITLRDVVEKLEYEFYHAGGRHEFFRGGYRFIQNILISLGLTRLDSVALPQKTVTKEMLKQLTKDELLAMNACVLGTMSTIVLLQCGEYYLEHIKCCEGVQRGSFLPSIAELLTIGLRWRWGNKAMIYRTVVLLKELGFTDDDGPFMQIADNTQKNVEKIMKQESVDEKTATLIVEMAQRRGWKI
ncbi:MAG: hypothetical protein WC678_04640 [Parcubacteria group bacterium]|jgi:hypothetical protein